MTARAMLVGVEQSSWGDVPRLPGVPSDLAAMSAVLGRGGFSVVTLPETSLHAASVKRALAQFVTDTVAGDLAVIYFTGHGLLLQDHSGDEQDGWDEALLCADEPIVDDWFRSNLWPLAADGARIVAIVDACHSDSAVLGLRPADTAAALPARIAQLGYWRLILAACRDQESTVDLGSVNEGGGVTTAALVETLTRRPGISYRDLWPEVATMVRDRHPDTGVGTPQMLSSGPDDSLLDAPAFRAA
jgi:hypothetical protein